jgi:RND superfamily putative drug exporter
MLKLAKWSVARPTLALTTWSIVAVALILIGLGVSSTVSPSVTVVKGTESSRAQQLADAHFGPSQLVPILLQGPKSQIDTQGPPLVRALAKRPHTRVMSAWDGGAATAELRRHPTDAMIVVSVDRSERNAVRYDEPQIERTVHRYISAPVKAYVTGQPSIDRAEKNAALSTLKRDELIAIGILFVLLLVGLRAPVAALLVAGVGAVSTFAGFGEVALLGHVMNVDPAAVALGTMTGLALGVAFALLILDRFHREELPEGGHPRDAATAALRELETTGRAVLVGGTALIVALALVAVIGPTELMVSLGTGMLTCAAFATGGAVVVMPAALVLLGRRIDAGRFPAPAFLERVWARLVSGGNVVVRYALFWGFAATAVLAALALPALSLNSGPPSITQLPAGAPARVAFEHVSKAMGPGWATPYDLIVVANGRPITTPALLTSLTRFQAQLAKNTSVDSVSGPASITATSDQLKSFGPGLAHSVKISDQSKKDLLKLIAGLGLAGSGAGQLQSGLATASTGANQLHSGSGSAGSGAAQLHAGLAQARSGSSQLSTGLNQALAGAVALKKGASQALAGSSQLAAGLGAGAPQVKAGLPALGSLASNAGKTLNTILGMKGEAATAQSSVAAATSALKNVSGATSDPQYQAALNALSAASGAVSTLNSHLSSATAPAAAAALLANGVKQQVGALAPQLTAAATGAAQLEAGIKQLRNGNAQLASGLSQLSGGGSQLHSGLGQLTTGAGQLEAGLALLTNGTGQLASGLSGGVGPAGQLVAGLGTMKAAVSKSRGQIPSTADLKKLMKESPGIFSSGYFVLSAVSGAPATQKMDATFTINLLRGGTAGQILVVSKHAAGDRRTVALGTAITRMARTWAKANNAQIAVGGPAGNLGDMTSLTKSRLWLDVAALALAIAVVLGLALRAVVLPIVTTAFSLLVSAATFGILEMLFGGSNPPLGGPGYMDPMTIIGVFTVVFGITVTFSTLLLMRTRELYVTEGHNDSAIRHALRDTAAAATGAGLVMVAALIPFATSEMINVREFGIGVAIAVLLDIVLVRPVLLPAAEMVLGRFGWWPTRAPSDTAPPTSDAVPPRDRAPGRGLHLPHRRPRPVAH